MSDGTDESSAAEVFDTVFNRNDARSSSSQLGNESAEARMFKIIVIGDSNVGKTCLTYRFCGGIFLQNPEATIGVDFREKTLELDGERIKVRGRECLEHTHLDNRSDAATLLTRQVAACVEAPGRLC